jgi:hypothetical protein
MPIPRGLDIGQEYLTFKMLLRVTEANLLAVSTSIEPKSSSVGIRSLK